MAWHSDEGFVSNYAEAFVTIRDFLAAQGDFASSGIGLDIVAWSYANNADNPQQDDYVIVKFPGEDGKKQCYFKLLYGANKFFFILSPWLSSEGDGGDLAPNTYFGHANPALDYNANDIVYLYLYGNKDEFFCYTDDSVPQLAGCGIMDTVFDNTWLTVTNVVDQGSDTWDLTLAEDLPPTWRADVMVMVTSQDSDGADHCVLCDVNSVNASSKTITVQNLGFTPRNGARVAIDFGMWVSSGNNLHNITLYIDHNGQRGHDTANQVQDLVWPRYDREGDSILPSNSNFYISHPFLHCNNTDFPYQLIGGHKYVFRMNLGNPPYHLDTIELARGYSGLACTLSASETYVFPDAIED